MEILGIQISPVLALCGGWWTFIHGNIDFCAQNRLQIYQILKNMDFCVQNRLQTYQILKKGKLRVDYSDSIEYIYK